MATIGSNFSSHVEAVSAWLEVGPFWLLLGMALLAVGWMHFSGGILGQTLWSYAGSLRNFDARVGNWAIAPRLTALLVGFLCFDLLFAAVYGDAAMRAARDPDLLNESQRWLLHQLALPTVGADWFENALLLLLILSASWRLERKRRRDIATEALAKDLREAGHADRRKDRWRPWFARKRKERWAHIFGRLACFLLALATTTKFAGVLAMFLLMTIGRAI